MDVSSNEQVADAVLPRTDGSPSPQNSSSGPSEMEKDSGRNQLINEYMQEGFGSLEVSSSTDAPVMEAVHSPPTRRATPRPTLNSDVLPSTSPQPPQTPSTDLICFESFRMASPTRGTHTPPQPDVLVPQGIDLLSASPTTLPPRTPQKTPGPSPGPLLDPQSGTREKQLLFTPRTTASFAADVDVPINTALLMTREKDRPTSLDGLKEQTPEDQDAERPVKRIKAETPLRSHKHSLSSPVKKLRPSPGHVPQRARLLGQSSAARSPEKGRMLGASTSYRPIAPKTPTRPAIPSARVPPTISRQLFATPQRPSATPQRPATVSKTESARSTAANYPPSGAPKLPSDFRFVFQSNIAMPTSPEAQEHTHVQKSGEAKTVLLNDFKFVPAPISPGSPPEAAGSDGDASSVKRSSRRTVSGPRTPSPEAPNDLNKAKPEEQSSPRRSRRISKEKENASTEDQPAKGPTKPVAAPRSRTPATPKAPPGSIGLQMSDKELKSLTMKNTVRNQTYFVEIDLQVVRKDCPRPPSPSSRVRAAIGIEEKEAEAKKRGRTERAKKRGLLEEEMDREEDESPSKHFLAPGDDEEYETPKRRKLDGEGGFAVGGVKTEERFAALQLQPAANGSKESRSRSGSSDPAAAATSGVDPDNRFVKPNSKGRFVRWNKKLAFYCETGAQPKAPSDPSKGILAKDASAAKLDKVGNVPEAGIQPPEVRKNVVVVFKYVYADDPSDNLKDEDMDDDEEYVEAPSPPKKGKRKRLA
ncbi:hypothetical protein FRB90_001369 [Tulasnella sp. 427]|nr:hypothetical protein FRB90_001369 [Tulasnella sp. 427]